MFLFFFAPPLFPPHFTPPSSPPPPPSHLFFPLLSSLSQQSVSILDAAGQDAPPGWLSFPTVHSWDELRQTPLHIQGGLGSKSQPLVGAHGHVLPFSAPPSLEQLRQPPLQTQGSLGSTHPPGAQQGAYGHAPSFPAPIPLGGEQQAGTPSETVVHIASLYQHQQHQTDISSERVVPVIPLYQQQQQEQTETVAHESDAGGPTVQAPVSLSLSLSSPPRQQQQHAESAHTSGSLPSLVGITESRTSKTVTESEEEEERAITMHQQLSMSDKPKEGGQFGAREPERPAEGQPSQRTASTVSSRAPVDLMKWADKEGASPKGM